VVPNASQAVISTNKEIRKQFPFTGKPQGVSQASGRTKQKAEMRSVTGFLGRYATVRETKSGKVVANFSVGVDESYKDLLGEWHRKMAWHRVQAWEGLAETVRNGLRAGMRVYVEGRLVVRDWVDRQNMKHTTREIVAKDVRFLDPEPRRNAQDGGGFTAASAAALQ
jgi:single-strand DNA-binding protein